MGDRPFHFKHFSMMHQHSTMRIGTDAVLLGRWVDVGPADTVLDVGTGCGIIAMMLAQRGAARIDAVELDADSVEEAALALSGGNAIRLRRCSGRGNAVFS